MSPRMYGSLWVFVLAVAGALWLAGLFSQVTLVVFGFVAFGMVFMGMMCVLPGMVAHPTTPKPVVPKPDKVVGNTSTLPSRVGGMSAYRSV